MTRRTLNSRVAKYTKAYEARQITVHEYNAFIEALAQIVAEG